MSAEFATDSIFCTQVQHFENLDSLKQTLDAIDRNNIRTSFKQAKDPINLAFQHVESKPLNKLAKEFVKDSFVDFLEFVTKVFE